MIDVKEWSVKVAYGLTVLVLAFLMLPIVMIVLMSFTKATSMGFPPSGFSMRWYREVATGQQWRDAALTSLIVGSIAMVVATVCGAGLALAAWRVQGRLAALITSAAMAPAIMPIVVMAAGLFFSLSPLSLVDTSIGLGLGHAVLAVPVVFLVVSAALQYFDRSLIEASCSTGATTAYAYRTVLFPFAAPAIYVAAVLAFMSSFDEVVVANFLGLSDTVTLPNLIWRSLHVELSPVVAAISSVVILLGITLEGVALVLLNRRLRARPTAQVAGQADSESESAETAAVLAGI